jgi:DNA sulfur modification protein DndC
MEAMILNDDEKSWMEPLLELRDDLDFRSEAKRKKERANRDFRRMSGRIELFEHKGEDGEPTVDPIPGPYIKTWREELLRKVLTTQETVRQLAPPEMKAIELISHDELLAIRRIWREEKHEFDDSLPRIYHEVTGQKFQDPRPNADTTTLGPDEWATLETLCGDDAMYLELVARLLDTERKYQTMSRRTGIYKALEGCFESSGLAKEPAIQRAETIRELKEAEKEGDVEVFQNAWAALKFGKASQET